LSNSGVTVVAGLGEVGKPLAELLSAHYEVVAFDVDHPPLESLRPVEVLHVCYPFEIPDFVATTAAYIEGLQPAVTIINSTVAVGTTRRVAVATGTRVVNSPVRGKHSKMLEELTNYVKFIGALDFEAGEMAEAHFAGAGMKTSVHVPPETTELAKLTETTYFGLLIAWAQEVERYADEVGVDYSEVASFYEEIGFFPQVKYFPGVIGGHCVMPNIEILREVTDSALLRAIVTSNAQKVERDQRRQESN
jgi:UDP-N-acetyl-D-mannosaminuronate dehydrogenase